MEEFKTNTHDGLFLMKVKVDTVKKAFTKVQYLIDNKKIKPPLAVSEIDENGNIDLDDNKQMQWKSIDIIGKFIGHTIEIVTIIENLPISCDTNEKVKEFILDNVRIDYDFKENSNSKNYKLTDNDQIELLVEQTGIISKKIIIAKS